MNEKQREKMNEIVLNEILDSETLRTTRPLEFIVFSHAESSKIPFKIITNGTFIDLFVIDYYNQELLMECSGYTTYSETTVKLNCEDHWAGYIYEFDEQMTKEFNAMYGRV